jgi:hypothetical protein
VQGQLGTEAAPETIIPGARPSDGAGVTVRSSLGRAFERCMMPRYEGAGPHGARASDVEEQGDRGTSSTTRSEGPGARPSRAPKRQRSRHPEQRERNKLDSWPATVTARGAGEPRKAVAPLSRATK